MNSLRNTKYHFLFKVDKAEKSRKYIFYKVSTFTKVKFSCEINFQPTFSPEKPIQQLLEEKGQTLRSTFLSAIF